MTDRNPSYADEYITAAESIAVYGYGFKQLCEMARQGQVGCITIRKDGGEIAYKFRRGDIIAHDLKVAEDERANP